MSQLPIRAASADAQLKIDGDDLIHEAPTPSPAAAINHSSHQKTEEVTADISVAPANTPQTLTPSSPIVAQSTPAEPGLDEPCAARRGRVEESDDVLLHFCVECGRFGPFGFGVRLRAGQLGRWYCAAHRPQT